MFTASSESGVLLLDAGMKPVMLNAQAIRILTFPTPAEKLERLDVALKGMICSSLLDHQAGDRAEFRREFVSGKRHYVCRSFYLSRNRNGAFLVAVFLERRPSRSTVLCEISSQFELTERERDVVELLVRGLTNKEIAVRLNISPNTVKAFLHLVMVKMDVSTRSGIVGKVVRPLLQQGTAGIALSASPRVGQLAHVGIGRGGGGNGGRQTALVAAA